MKNKQIGKLGVEVSRLGFGAMRLPMRSLQKGLYGPDVDEDEAVRMIQRAVEQGVNYFDTAYGYHGGNSERVVGKALQEYRDKVLVATKLPTWLVEEAADFERLLDEQLAKLDVDIIDFYLLHGLRKDRWQKVYPLGFSDFLENMVDKGKIRYPAFSFHDELSVFKDIIDAYNWPLCQIQLNFMDAEYQAGVEGLRYAASKGTAVVIMEPLKGGCLVQRIPAVDAVWNKSPVRRSSAGWDFRWLSAQPEETLLLNGMSTMEQLEDNLRIFSELDEEPLTDAEQQLYEEVVDAYKAGIMVDCTACGYCQPCPSGVNIPGIFEVYNYIEMYKNDAEWLQEYRLSFLDKGSSALECSECGECEEKCPQKIHIIEELKAAHNRLTSS